jgi:NifU-like protein involved in Fe-S cluster formation
VDEPVIKYYRKLLRLGSEYTGSIENPSIFLDSKGENISVCAQVAEAYVHLYVSIRNNVIEDIKYLCTCDPTANVAVEILCHLIKGTTIEEVKLITEDLFSQEIGSKSEDFIKSARGLIELLNRGLLRYQAKDN